MIDGFPEYVIRIKNTRVFGNVKLLDYENKVVKFLTKDGKTMARMFDEVELIYRYKDADKDYFTLLTEAEIKVLRLLAQGYSTKEISEKLVIAFATVRTHETNIRQKLLLNGLSNGWRIKAAKIAEFMGIVDSLN